MDGYLFDTNTIRYWFDRKCDEHERVSARIKVLELNAAFYVSVITLGEIEYGHRVESDELTEVQAEFSRFVDDELPQVLQVSRHAAAEYGDVRARLCKKFGSKSKRRNRLQLEPLGIDENDLWLAAQAIERNLVLVTHDRLVRIRKVVPKLMVEDWAAATDSEDT